MTLVHRRRHRRRGGGGGFDRQSPRRRVRRSHRTGRRTGDPGRQRRWAGKRNRTGVAVRRNDRDAVSRAAARAHRIGQSRRSSRQCVTRLDHRRRHHLFQHTYRCTSREVGISSIGCRNAVSASF